MFKRLFYIILLIQFLSIGCSKLGKLGMDKGDIEKIKKGQEMAIISKNIYDIQDNLRKDDIDFSTISYNLLTNGFKEYKTIENLIDDLKSMSKSLEDGKVSLPELKEYSKFTGFLADISEPLASSYLTNTSNEKKTADSSYTTQPTHDRKVVTLAEINSNNIESIEEFTLPEDAIIMDKLDLIDSLYYYNYELFNGKAYSLFDNGQIGEFKTIKEGRLSGPAYSWYEDGTFAMQANFIKGYLAGRFIAWSEVGDLIYDMYFDKGQFQSDLQYERDTTREQQDNDASEGDADSQGNSGE